MLDFFIIITRSGLVLFASSTVVTTTKEVILTSVNALVRSVILQERSSSTSSFDHNSLRIQYKLDNEFELIFIAAYQKILALSYVDKFLSDIHRQFRDRYLSPGKGGSGSKNDMVYDLLLGNGSSRAKDPDFDYQVELGTIYNQLVKDAEIQSFEEARAPRVMRSFEQSKKSTKTVGSMILGKDGKKAGAADLNENQTGTGTGTPAPAVPPAAPEVPEFKIIPKGVQRKPGPGKFAAGPKSPKASGANGAGTGAGGKKPRQWEGQGSPKDLASLDRSAGAEEREILYDKTLIGKAAGDIKPLECGDDDDYDEDFYENGSGSGAGAGTKAKGQTQSGSTGTAGAGSLMGNFFKGLVGGKTITATDLAPALEKLRNHLISKNVAAEVATKLCESVGSKLEGQSLATFSTIASTVSSALSSSLLTLLTPKRQINILREILESRRSGRPFVITFCGVNGVGKSTNLAKIAFWLIENGHTVLVAACDTFRAGAVEQLRTHARCLNAMHPRAGMPFVQLYEKGYGKDAAGVAAEAIGFAKEKKIDIVLVDTAGRMQDNEPLMRALAKLIRVNDPDLVLFVGEALVGNEAVDQLIKFNRALADFSDAGSAKPRLIDGMVLTKFDTIDDKVGAAISMVYITGQPILFVGTGQTYTDLRALDSRAVVRALLK